MKQNRDDCCIKLTIVKNVNEDVTNFLWLITSKFITWTRPLNRPIQPYPSTVKMLRLVKNFHKHLM